jgi:2-succinyl-5-enolpyruvyl-6-hydroxy-3-cyclohexene-1-carboxylate synthase
MTNLNTLWAELTINTLVANGVRYFCISPGSRSTPLTLAASKHPEALCRVIHDERGAAFHALGYARVTGVPAALICTSGTAVANYYPAVIEAAQDLVPLVVLSADRPPELRDCGANQTIQQQHIFGDYVREFVELPVPQARLSPRYLVTRIEHALFSARAFSGPVHLNFPFAEPLTPSPAEEVSVYAQSIAALTLPQTVYQDLSGIQGFDGEKRLQQCLQQQGLLVIGRLPAHEDPSAILALAAHLQWPVFADPLSNVRGALAAEDYGISSYDLLLRQPDVRAELMDAPFSVILHLGQGFVSKSLLQYLNAYLEQHPHTEYIQVTPQRGPQDPNYRVHQHIVARPTHFAQTCLADPFLNTPAAPTPSKTTALMMRLRDYQQQARQHILAHSLSAQQGLNELTVAAMCLSALHQWPAQTPFFIGNSMAIRDVDSVYAQAETPLLVGSRGTSGIDGNVSMVAGMVAGTGKPCAMLCGDLTLYHDLNALGTFRTLPAGVVVVVVNNQGGGIFSFLPVSQTKGGVDDPERVDQYFGTPHPWHFAGAAQMFGLHYHQPAAPEDFLSALQTGLRLAAQGESSLIEVRSERALNYAVHQAFYTLLRD